MNRSEMADLLEKAADLYESEQVEWCQQRWAVKRGDRLSVCAEGAIYLAAGVEADWLLKDAPYTNVEAMERGDLAIKILSTVTVEQFHKRLHQWNDTMVGITKADVIDLMKEKAKELRNEGSK